MLYVWSLILYCSFISPLTMTDVQDGVKRKRRRVVPWSRTYTNSFSSSLCTASTGVVRVHCGLGYVLQGPFKTRPPRLLQAFQRLLASGNIWWRINLCPNRPGAQLPGPVSSSRNPGFGQALDDWGKRFWWPCGGSSL